MFLRVVDAFNCIKIVVPIEICLGDLASDSVIIDDNTMSYSIIIYLPGLEYFVT